MVLFPYLEVHEGFFYLERIFSKQKQKINVRSFTPFSSDKIRAKILDLGYGGARHEPSIT